MNPNKFNSSKSNGDVAKKVGIGAATLVGAISLAACSNNTTAKPGASEPKTEQVDNNKNVDNTDNNSNTNTSSSDTENSHEGQSLNEYVDKLKNSGFTVISTDGSSETSYYIEVEVAGYIGYAGSDYVGGTNNINFDDSLGVGSNVQDSDLPQAVAKLKQLAAQK